MENGRIQKLYMDTFFQNQGIGGKLIDFAIQKCEAKSLFVLEKTQTDVLVLNYPLI